MAKISLSKMGMGGGVDTAGTMLPLLPTSGAETGADRSTPSPRRRARVSLSKVNSDANFQATFNPGEFLGQMVQDTVKGAVAPITLVSEGMMGVLSDPMVGILPAEDQKEHFDKAGQAAIDGAAFYGSMAVGMGIAGAPIKSAIARAVATGAGSGATFPIVNQLPDFMRGDVSPGDYAAGAATAAVFGGLVGGTLSGFTPVTKYALRKADAVIEANPFMKSIKGDISKYMRKTAVHTWDKFFTSGGQVLRKYGLGEVAEKLEATRSLSGFTAGRFVTKFLANTKDLTNQQKEIMGAVLDTVPFHKSLLPNTRSKVMETLKNYYGELIGDFDKATFDLAFDRARKESIRLRSIGKLLQKSGVQVYDEASDTLHSFALRDAYYPHRLVNPDFYRPNGRFYDEAIQKVMKKFEMYEDDAAVWVQEFADRIADQNGDFVAGRTATLSSSYYLRGRSLDLPGFELNVDNVLPQYYEHAAKRLHTHTMFGPKPIETGARVVQENLFDRDTMNKLLADQQSTYVEPKLPVVGEATGQGMKRTILPEKPLTDTDEIIKELIQSSKLDLTKENATLRRYPGAYKDLYQLRDDPERQKLALAIIRRQIGSIEKPLWGEETLGRLSHLEIVTKLALGAIAQPSQMLTAVFRTEFKGAVKNLVRTFADPDAADFALRSAVTLKGIVRASEQSLTGRDTDFLSKVFFTQMDMKSRVFGALQGASFAEHQASKLSRLVRKYPALRDPETGRFSTAHRPPKIQKQMQQIERKLMEVGLDPVKIVKRGGYLTEEETLMAAQTVSSDVNFWGDSLSLPEFFRSPVGRYVTQFKSFGFQQSKLIKDHLIKPIKDHGDWGPFVRFAILMPAAGEIIADAKGLVRANYRRFSKEGDNGPVTRVLENIANASGFGLVYDAIEATKYGNSGSLGFMVGPIGTDIAKTWNALGDLLVRGSPKKAMRQAIELGLPAATLLPTLGRVPGLTPAVAAATPALSNLLLPKREAP